MQVSWRESRLPLRLDQGQQTQINPLVVPVASGVFANILVARPYLIQQGCPVSNTGLERP